ncbi:unnamed protein product, partial [Closterium sp. NIES-65]
RFLCWGRFIFGPDVRSLVISVVLILVPGTLFCIFVAAPYAGKLPGGIAVLPVSICFVIWNLFILLVTASRDPGIVPRNLVPPQPDEEAGEQAAGGAPKKLPRAKEVVVNGHTVKVKYCDTCLLYRPPRCSHCSICDNCIEKFDHHCPWVGQCIGRRNYPFFFLFVTTTTLLCIFVFTLSAFYIKLLVDNSYPGASGQSISLLEALGKGYMAAVLMVYTFIMVWFVGGLTGFHSFLISRNQLGKEYLAAVLMVYTFIMVWFIGGLTGFHSFLTSRNQLGKGYLAAVLMVYTFIMLGKGYLAAVLMVYTFIMVWFVGGLTGFHSFLISRNQVCVWQEWVALPPPKGLTAGEGVHGSGADGIHVHHGVVRGRVDWLPLLPHLAQPGGYRVHWSLLALFSTCSCLPAGRAGEGVPGSGADGIHVHHGVVRSLEG